MLILATQSQTRITLLKNAGYEFKAIPARIDEREIEQSANAQSLDQSELTVKLAAAKAQHVSNQYPEAHVIGADQTLSFKDRYLHKPADQNALKEQLDYLKGETHHLCAAVALARNGETIWSHQSIAKMKMRQFSDGERDQIIGLEGDQLLQSVGGYRLEGPSVRLFEEIDGDYFTILGLPLLPLIGALNTYMETT